MKRFSGSALLVIMVFSANAQSGVSVGPRGAEDSVYYAAVREFVADFIASQRNFPGDFILRDSVFNDFFPASRLNDSAIFTAAEQEQIRSRGEHPRFAKWTAEMAPAARIVPKDTIDHVFSHARQGGWSYFHARFGYSFHYFSCPLFLRDYSWCLFYSDYHCDKLCGAGQWALYKKEKGHWVLANFWGMWIS